MRKRIFYVAGIYSAHDYEALNAVVEEITSHFKQQLKSADTKITDVHKLDKQSWAMLDVVEGDCNKWIAEIEAVRDEQVM
jgi:uncharacterized protein (DUF2344 family)